MHQIRIIKMKLHGESFYPIKVPFHWAGWNDYSRPAKSTAKAGWAIAVDTYSITTTLAGAGVCFNNGKTTQSKNRKQIVLTYRLDCLSRSVVQPAAAGSRWEVCSLADRPAVHGSLERGT